jgi:hypothetical protein
MLKYFILFLMQINAFSQTKIGPQELSQPFVIVSSNTKQQALIIDNDYDISNGYNFVISTTGNVGIGVSQPKTMLDINVNPNQKYALTIDTNNNASDGYVVSVDTNGFLIAPNNKIGYTFVASTASSTNVTSLTLSNLNIQADDVCRLYVNIKSEKDAAVFMFLNNDETVTNYWTKGIYTYGTGVNAETLNEPRISVCYGGYSTLAVVELFPSLYIESVYRWHSQVEVDPIENSTISSIRIYSGRSSPNKTAPISTIKITLFDGSNNINFTGIVRLFCNKSGRNL